MTGPLVAGGGSDRSAARGLAFEHGPPPGFSNLADTLGVDADKLEDALGDFHEQEHAERRDELADKLAEALDVPADKVKTALERHSRPARAALRVARRARARRPARAAASRSAMPCRCASSRRRST